MRRWEGGSSAGACVYLQLISQCCMAETNTTLQRNYPPIKKKKRWWPSARADPGVPDRTSFPLSVLQQRTGPEGTLGPGLLLSSRVALPSVSMRYTVSVTHTNWRQFRVLSEAVGGAIFFGLKIHQSPHPVTLLHESHLCIPFLFWVSSKPAHSQRPSVEAGNPQSHIWDGDVGC